MWTPLDLTKPFCSIVFAAHPDDEVIGLGTFLPALSRGLTIVHLADGAPEEIAYAQEAGFDDNRLYAEARRREVEAALALAGIPSSAIHCLGYRDRSLVHNLSSLAVRVTALLREIRPGVVFTHPYEGGHIDHDSTAFAVRLAVDACPPTRLFEFASYHASGDDLVTAQFLPRPDHPHWCRTLEGADLALKQRMLACFPSQAHFLHRFSFHQECLREAPRYDFARPPHEGPLFYESMYPPVSPGQWRRLASEASRLLQETHS